jgi:hypothetical protein
VSFSEATAKVTGPGGVVVPLTRIPGTAIGICRAPGLYVAEGGGARSTFAVNTADPERSNLTHTNLQPSTTAASARGILERQWWIGCAIAAFMIALAEWWTWQRRVTV